MKRIKELKQQLKRTCIHEAGHKIVAEHFKCPCLTYVGVIGEPTLESRRIDGHAIIRGTTPYRAAVIGWSGTVAEKLSVLGKDETGKAIYQAHSGFPIGMSKPDVEKIQQTPFKWRACVNAAEILSRKWDQVEVEADRLRLHALDVLKPECLVCREFRRIRKGISRTNRRT